MNDKSKFVAAVIGLLVMAILAGRQPFLFAAFRDAQGLLNSLFTKNVKLLHTRNIFYT